MFTYSVGTLIKQPEGTIESHPVDAKFDLGEADISVISKLTGTIKVMKIEGGFNVQLHDMSIDVELICNSCLEPFIRTIKIPYVERQFMMEGERKHAVIDDTFRVNVKDLKIDVSEMLRQEILIHIPSYPVCRDNCKALHGKFGIIRIFRLIDKCDRIPGIAFTPFESFLSYVNKKKEGRLY